MRKEDLYELFQDTTGDQVEEIRKLTAAGSQREYFRLRGNSHQAIGVYSPDPLETRAFLGFTRHFRSMGLNVPELLAEKEDEGIYLLQDLGDLTLKDAVELSRKEGDYPAKIIPLYQKALDHLLRFQVEGPKGIDYSLCVPRPDFDRQSVMWDLNHFKYFFIKLLGIPFDEQKLENDFEAFADLLAGSPSDFFMYRDFQSRNIMIHQDDLYFVDYQGGRRGPLQYDVASLLFEARVDLNPDLREELLEYYLGILKEKTATLSGEFKQHYYAFVLIRILQALGAYGIRGIVEGKALFLQSIPYAVRNLRWLKENSLIPTGLSELSACLDRISEMKEWQQTDQQQSIQNPIDPSNELTVKISSFSYKKGIPRDLSGNGGGFVFDCRALPNPGREEKYRSLCGRDQQVIDFLEDKEEVKSFLDKSFSLVEQSISEYSSRGFDNLMVNFGCTGGQHRSVYSAESLNKFITEKYNVKTELHHRELG